MVACPEQPAVVLGSALADGKSWVAGSPMKVSARGVAARGVSHEAPTGSFGWNFMQMCVAPVDLRCPWSTMEKRSKSCMIPWRKYIKQELSHWLPAPGSKMHLKMIFPAWVETLTRAGRPACNSPNIQLKRLACTIA